MQRLTATILALLISCAPLVATAQTVPEQVPIETETEVEAMIATSTPEVVATEEVSTTPAIIEPAGDYVPGEVLVKYKQSRVDLEVATDQREADETIQSLEMETQEVIEGMNIAVVEVPSDMSLGEAMAQLEAQPDIEYVEPNYLRSIEVLATTSAELAGTWGLYNNGQVVNSITGIPGADIDALSAWNIASGTGVTVAVIDTGVDYTHSELSGQMWDGSSCVSETGTTSWSCVHGYDFEYDTSDPRATTTATAQDVHGTHVSGIMAATHDDAGMVGIAYGARIMALRFDLDTASEIRAIDFAIQNGVKIINASYAGETYSQAEHDAIERFQNAGGLFVASAGNNGRDTDADPLYPANYTLDGIISVTATDSSDELASYANYGHQSVDLAAPGSNILSTLPLGGYAYKSGTSMSAPFVSGVAALLWSYDPTLTAAEVKQALMDGGDVLPDLNGTTVSGKRLSAYGSLALVQATTTAPAADTESPVITLLGSNPMNLSVGDTFTDPGAEVTDNVDATTTIIGVGTVDTTTAGTYTLTYSATDTAGNVATSTTRSVIVAAAIVSSGGGGGGGSSSSSSSSSSRRGGGGGGSSSTTAAKPKVAEPSVPRPLTTGPQVLGASTYVFTRDLSQGASGTDVSELQQTLAKLGYYTGPISGYYGPLTASAVSAYQSAKGLTAVGRVGPQTRAALNGTGVATTSTSSSTAATITLLQAQLQVLLARLAELQAQGR